MTATAEEFTLRAIGHVRSPHRRREDVPKGLGAKHVVEGTIEVRPELELGLRDIDGFSHLYVIWIFHASEGYELLGPNPTDGLEHGVFATRSPRRPNPLGLSVVELLGRDGAVLRVRGLDMLDGTPVVDLKPYLSSIPPEKLRRGWLEAAEERARGEGQLTGGQGVGDRRDDSGKKKKKKKEKDSMKGKKT